MSRSNQYPEHCVIWPGKLDKDGYGCLWAGKYKRAHRVFYSLFLGEIPSGMVVRHTCDTPACVNPAHLEVGTQTENIGDRVRRKRTAHGTKSGQAKLNADQVRAIRNGMSRDEAIAAFGIKKSCYYRTRNGEGYLDVSS